MVLFYGVLNIGDVNAAFSMDKTRYIFNGDKDSISITVTNDGKKTFGGQAWIDNILEKDTRPTFVVTPSFFKIKGDGKQVLRVIQANELPQDKESVYWMNLQEIPPAMEGNGLAIAIRTRVKLFYRPVSLLKGRVNAESKMTVEKKGNGYLLVNSTPYIFAISAVYNNMGQKINLSQNVADKLLMFMPGDKIDVSEKLTKVDSVDDYGVAQNVAVGH
ncbi:fimbria/pilus periplasmic chaperone [Salmonella enterica]|nr:fimbria/pilus periplasmic chaperone [Salmonella enterica]